MKYTKEERIEIYWQMYFMYYAGIENALKLAYTIP